MKMVKKISLEMVGGLFEAFIPKTGANSKGGLNNETG